MTSAPAATAPAGVLQAHSAIEASHHETDKWIECLIGCKALSEVEIRALCEKVRALATAPRREKNRFFSR